MHHQMSLPPISLATIWPRLERMLHANCTDQITWPRLHRVTRGAHTLGASMLCLWRCGSRGCISLIVLAIEFSSKSVAKYEWKWPLLYTCISTLKLNFSPVRGSILGSVASWPYHAVAAYSISKLKLNFSPVRGSISIRFRSIEPPEFILLAIAFSSKSAAKYKF